MITKIQKVKKLLLLVVVQETWFGAWFAGHIMSNFKLLCLIFIFSFISHGFCIAEQEFIPILEKELPNTKSEFYEKYVNKSQPVLFRGAARQLPAKKWTLDYFKNKYGDFTVDILKKEILSNEEYGSVITEYKQEKLADFIKNIEEKGIGAGYLHQFQILDYYPELEGEVNFPNFYISKYLVNKNIWIGPKGTKSKLHYDSDHNLFIQIYGSKLITLISPEDSENCYPTNKTWYDGFSPIDVLNPDYTKYPRFKKITKYQSLIKDGDMVYIPKGWWHDIRSMEDSISFNLWWISWPDFMKETFMELYHVFVQGEEFESKNSYLHSLKKELRKPPEPHPSLPRTL